MDLSQHLHRRRRPAQQRLMQDAERQHVEAGQGDILTPGQRRRRVSECGIVGVNTHLAQVAQEPAPDQFKDDFMRFKAVGTGHNLCDQIRESPRRPQHAVGFGGVHAHARLGQHVLARFQRREGNRTVQIGPGADNHGVNVGVGSQVLPALEGARHVVFLRDRRRRFGPAIADGDDLHVRQRTQSRNMASTGVGSGADQSDTDSFLDHDVLLRSFFYWENVRAPTGCSQTGSRKEPLKQ